MRRVLLSCLHPISAAIPCLTCYWHPAVCAPQLPMAFGKSFSPPMPSPRLTSGMMLNILNCVPPGPGAPRVAPRPAFASQTASGFAPGVSLELPLHWTGHRPPFHQLAPRHTSAIRDASFYKSACPLGGFIHKPSGGSLRVSLRPKCDESRNTDCPKAGPSGSIGLWSDGRQRPLARGPEVSSALCRPRLCF